MDLYLFHTSDATIEVADTFPSTGGYTLTIPGNTEVLVDVPPDVFVRLRPQLQLLAEQFRARSLIFFWAIWRPSYAVAGYTPGDVRGNFTPLYPIMTYRGISPGQISLAAVNTVVTLKGRDLLNGCETAKCTVGAGAGAVAYENLASGDVQNVGSVIHVKPGPSTALSVAYVSPNLVVTLATNGGGAITSTANQVATAVNASSYGHVYYATVPTAGTAQAGSAAFTGGTGPMLVFNVGAYTSLPTSITRATSGMDSGRVRALTFDIPQGALTDAALAAGDCLIVSITLDSAVVTSFPLAVVA